MIAQVNSLLDILEAGEGSVASTASIASNLKTVQWYIPRFNLSYVFTAQFIARIRNEIEPNQLNVIAQVAVLADSYPGNVYGMTGRNYSASSSSPALHVPVPSTALIQFVTNIPTNPLADLSVHEISSYQFNLTLPQVTSSVLANVTLPLSTPMIALEGDFVIGGDITCSKHLLTLIDTNSDSIPDVVAFDFGICVNSYLSSAADGDTIILTVVTALVDDAANQAGTPVILQADLQYGDNALYTPYSVITKTVSMQVVEPVLITDPILSDRVTTSDAGDIVRSFGTKITLPVDVYYFFQCYSCLLVFRYLADACSRS